jgi:transcriptional regulator with XRE-family HTH domain
MRGRGNGKTPLRVTELLADEIKRIGWLATSKGLGLTVSVIHRYLHGTVEPTRDSLQKLANYFNETFIIEVKPERQVHEK